VYLPQDSVASDYRLLGPDVTTGGIIYDEQQQDHQYVSYQLAAYSYEIPSLKDLTNKRRMFVLHHSLVNPKKTSSRPTVWLVLGLISITFGAIASAWTRRSQQ